MVYLLLCILSSTGIFIVFKFLDKKNHPPFPVIVINYLVASLIGFLINKDRFVFSELIGMSWIPISVIIGFLFIVMFFIIAKSSKEAGISVTTIAGKMSVVFPIAFSIFLETDDRLTIIKAVAILAALVGVLLSIHHPGKISANRNRILIPLILFIGMGIVDSLVKFSQFKYVNNDEAAIFSAVLFSMAFLTGIIIIPFRKKGITEFKNASIWQWGLLLGIVNFGSIFLMVSALNHINDNGVQIDSSVIFGINNIGVVSLSVIAGLFLFREKLSKINWSGIVISACAILLFSLA